MDIRLYDKENFLYFSVGFDTEKTAILGKRVNIAWRKYRAYLESKGYTCEKTEEGFDRVFKDNQNLGFISCAKYTSDWVYYKRVKI